MPDRSLPSVSVVIPTKGRPDLLERCLAAVLADQAASEVVVVVDGADPETERLLERLAGRDSRLRATRTPEEPAELHRVQRGRDHGVGLASSELVLSMDDDVVAGAGLVGGHARAHADRDDLVIVGYMPVVTERRWPRSSAQIKTYAGAYEEICDQFEADPSSILCQLWGGNVSVRRHRWLEAIKRPRVPSYLDDKEIGLLFLDDGLQAAFDRSLRADHFYERTLRGLVERAEKNYVAQADLRSAHSEAGRFYHPDESPRLHLRVLAAISRPAAGWFAVKWILIALISLMAVLRIRVLEEKGEAVLSWLAWERTAERHGG